MFRRILIANRGEIAVRVLRTAREMGVECVSVFSEFDSSSLHARLADIAMPLGGQTPAESYLDGDKIIAAAKASGAEAIHPGYGFLSENASFARAVTEAGLTWIGPPPEAIESMGDKITSRRVMQKAGVPLVPGLTDAVVDPDSAVAAAEGIGYPVALKAAAGGGGKGIRVVREPSEMALAFRTASGEAVSAFGDGRLYLERYLDHPHHVEVQVMFDQYGHGVHYGERDCSIQRRHQKLVEETPSPVVDEEMRREMGEVALAAGRTVGYVGAGTVEFLASPKPGGGFEFFFLEMNTRLQVEHPVTEMVTGIDLVREQLRVAFGEPLGYDQADVHMNGHSMEVRINAEDPLNGFVPSMGTISNLRWPGGPWVRVDSGLYRGMEVGLNYDPMLAKVIVWAPDREQAMARMRRALQEMNVGGVRTSAPAALAVLDNERFRTGDFDTHLLESMDLRASVGAEVRAAALAATVHRYHQARRRAMVGQGQEREAWAARGRAAVSNRRALTRGMNIDSTQSGGATE
ncbi:MAG: acetyl-CoA carboxylase biotin carboxylase subunit [Planctomycetota bacterium]|jgi:acetyl-CoA carboxylase biotin carboxylase subunit